MNAFLLPLLRFHVRVLYDRLVELVGLFIGSLLTHALVSNVYIVLLVSARRFNLNDDVRLLRYLMPDLV